MDHYNSKQKMVTPGFSLASSGIGNWYCQLYGTAQSAIGHHSTTVTVTLADGSSTSSTLSWHMERPGANDREMLRRLHTARRKFKHRELSSPMNSQNQLFLICNKLWGYSGTEIVEQREVSLEA